MSTAKLPIFEMLISTLSLSNVPYPDLTLRNLLRLKSAENLWVIRQNVDGQIANRQNIHFQIVTIKMMTTLTNVP
jgi:hypothetical protein